MQQYLDLLSHVVENGAYKSDRTGTGTYSVFGHQMRFDLQKGFPLLTTKNCIYAPLFTSFCGFEGSTNTAYLKENKVTIWDEWADEDGGLGQFTATNGVVGLNMGWKY